MIKGHLDANVTRIHLLYNKNNPILQSLEAQVLWEFE